MKRALHGAWITWRAAGLIATATAGVILGLFGSGVWSSAKHHHLIVGLVIWLGFAALQADVLALHRELRGPRDDDLRRRCTDHVGALPSGISKATGGAVPTDVIGVSVFRVTKPKRLRRRSEELRRILRHRDDSHPGPSALKSWSREKGVIGKAWKQNRVIHEELRHVVKDHEGTSEDDFEKVPKDYRWGMTYDEWTSIIGKYAEVLAVPIHAPNDGPIVGLIAIDLPIEVPGFKILNKQPIKEQVEFVARLLAPALI